LRTCRALAAAFGLLLAGFSPAVPAEERATILWKGESHPIGTLGGREFVISDAARALGLTVSSDAATGVLTVSGGGHQILVGPGTAQVPVDRRIVAISAPARIVAGALYAPPDFFEKVLFPIASVAGTWDAAKKTWTLTPTIPPVSIEVAVVHVAPTTQVVLRLSAAAKTATALSEKAFQVRFTEGRIDPPFPEKKYDDPLVSAVRFAGETVSIELREPNLSARSYPLTAPDRLVVEIGRKAAAPPAAPAKAPEEAEAPAPAPATAAPQLTIVVDPGHGGTETGAIGPGGCRRRTPPSRSQEARRDTAEGPFLPHGPHARHGPAALARRSDLDRQPREGNLFLSVHANSSRAASAQGSETYYLSLEASTRSRRRSPGARTRPAAPRRPARARRPGTRTSTSSSGTSPRART
jgi:N-acetylmuramoyl-L-alanine amidase